MVRKGTKGILDSLDPLDLQNQLIPLVGLCTSAGDGPPVLAHLEQSWSTQEGLQGVNTVSVEEELTSCACITAQST